MKGQPMKITAKFLAEHDACPEQVALFRKTFPRDGSVTMKNLLKAVEAGLSIDWLDQFIPPERSKLYDETIAAARKLYAAAIAPANKLYNEAIAPANKLYNETIAPALSRALDKEGEDDHPDDRGCRDRHGRLSGTSARQGTGRGTA